jgi:hypothetical protein
MAMFPLAAAADEQEGADQQAENEDQGEYDPLVGRKGDHRSSP